MWYGGHNPNKAYHRAAKFFLNCCRWSRDRGEDVMHPDDWYIPRHDAYRILTFLGPELAGLWPGPPSQGLPRVRAGAAEWWCARCAAWHRPMTCCGAGDARPCNCAFDELI